MRLGILDCSAMSEAEPTAATRFPSPSLLAAAHAVTADSIVYIEPSSVDANLPIDRVLAAVPAWAKTAADALLARCPVPIERIDPWARNVVRSGYQVAARGCHGEVDLAPHRWPVHPWVLAPSEPATDDGARLRACFDGLAALHTTRIVLGDASARLTMERLRAIAEQITLSLRNRKSLVELALRVWPEDLAVEKMVDHVSLLPIAGLDLLIGSMSDVSRERMKVSLSAAQVESLVADISRAGLGPVTTLSIAVALPGETIQDSITVLDRTLRLAAEHRLAAVRCALWFDGGAPPASPAEQQTRFLASHPTWSEEEYRGFHDLVAVIRQVAPNIELAGPGFVATWDSVP